MPLRAIHSIADIQAAPTSARISGLSGRSARPGMAGVEVLSAGHPVDFKVPTAVWHRCASRQKSVAFRAIPKPQTVRTRATPPHHVVSCIDAKRLGVELAARQNKLGAPQDCRVRLVGCVPRRRLPASTGSSRQSPHRARRDAVHRKGYRAAVRQSADAMCPLCWALHQGVRQFPCSTSSRWPAALSAPVAAGLAPCLDAGPDPPVHSALLRSQRLEQRPTWTRPVLEKQIVTQMLVHPDPSHRPARFRRCARRRPQRFIALGVAAPGTAHRMTHARHLKAVRGPAPDLRLARGAQSWPVVQEP